MAAVSNAEASLREGCAASPADDALGALWYSTPFRAACRCRADAPSCNREYYGAEVEPLLDILLSA